MDRHLGELLARVEGAELEFLAWEVRHELQRRVSSAESEIYRYPVHPSYRLSRQLWILAMCVATMALTAAVWDVGADEGFFRQDFPRVLFVLFGFRAKLLFWPSFFLLVACAFPYLSLRASTRTRAIAQLQLEIGRAKELLLKLDSALGKQGAAST